MRRLSSQQSFIGIVLFIILLCLSPVVVVSLDDPTDLVELAVFAALDVGYTLAYFRWLQKYKSAWVQTATVFACWALATAFTALFSDDFPNAYLALLIGVQIIFALQGLRYGLMMLGLSLASAGYGYFTHPGMGVTDYLFALAVLAASGLLTWYFVARAEQANKKERAMSAEVTALNRHILISQDSERRRLARDVHDGPLQSMGVQLLAIERTSRLLERGDMDSAQAEMRGLRQLTRDTIHDLRDTVSALRNTLLDSSLELALQNLARRTSDATGLRIEANVNIARRLPEELQTCIYQIVMEALNNVRKHAMASQAEIALWEKRGKVYLTVKDNGVGFDGEARLRDSIRMGHIGLHTMRERAAEMGGAMTVVSRPGSGAELRFKFSSASAPVIVHSHSHTVPADGVVRIEPHTLAAGQ